VRALISAPVSATATPGIARATRLAEHVPSNSTLRCRTTCAGVVIEVGQEGEDFLVLTEIAGALCDENGRAFVGVARYRRGSMFVRG